ncbi:2-dehydro-3-deoxygluconokinase [Arthrobacter sp. B3I9]|uniref:sugar kinase n=1 Tax=Arthrobacter sp. B3I9 TaxID=3042270 RepID=UPI00278DE5E7|nr:sugar kinase [Arthrobacter sp. B3I9]MDQ0848205.1 2-dehydro-3-deoxygluconokinase [Arthrobacter sp. B3I9]
MNAQAGHGHDGASEVVTLGETMALMKAATPGPLAFTDSLGLGIGGAESNVAIALRRLGTTVTWVGRAGADSLGDLVVRELLAEGLDVVCTRDGSAPTGLMIKERRTNQTAKVWYYRSGSAGSGLAPEHIPADKISRARLLHITGITPALSDSAAKATQYAVDCAKDSGTLVSFDLNYRSALWSKEEASDVFRRLVSQADVVFAGDDEAAIAVGPAGDVRELARRVAELGPSQVIIKLGADGCAALVDGMEYRQPAIPIRAVDTVGAGDAFVGGYLAELLNGEPVQQRLLTAVKTGAYACLVSGDWEGMPRRSELPLLDAAEPVSR